MRLYFLFVCFWLGRIAPTPAQMTVSVDVTHPTCSANGEITANVSGGSGSYNYQLSNDCGDSYPPQNNGFFSTLPPCTYQLLVTDQATGDMATEPVVLTPIQSALAAALSVEDCQVHVLVNTGTPPFVFSYSTTGSQGPYTSIGNESVLPDLTGQEFWVQVVDGCGNALVLAGEEELTAITDFDVSQQQDGLQFTPSDGMPPFQFQLSSSFGTYESTTGFFPWEEVGCSPRVTITSDCNGYTLANQYVYLFISGTVGCIRVSEGYAEVTANYGRPPLTFRAETPSGIFTSAMGIFTDLPPNEAYYRFSVEDACGLDDDEFHETTRYQLTFSDQPANCEGGSLAFRVVRQCSGRFEGPLTVNCLSCPSPESQEQNYPVETVLFEGPLSPGEWDIQWTDNCGDQVSCQDTVILEVLTACDSIVASVVDQFICDNGIRNRRLIADTSALFTLLDEDGYELESGNTTGHFTGLAEGAYQVMATTACGVLSANATLGEGTGIDPEIAFTVSRNHYGFDSCQLHFDLTIEKEQGPFVVSGGPGGNYYQVLNNYGQDNCRWYRLYDLLPGDYTVTSMSRCGSVDFTLPEVNFSTLDSATVARACPEESSIELHTDYRNNYDWYQYFQAAGMEVANDYLHDRYLVNGGYHASTTINNLPSGDHTIYLVPRFVSSNCPVDSIQVNIPVYEDVELSVSGDVLCDSNAFSDLRLRPTKGQAPYTIREVNCANPSQAIASHSVLEGEELLLEGYALGTYCFVVYDDCYKTRDFQVQVRPYVEEIAISYTCAPLLQLVVDTFNAHFAWYDQSGDLLGNSSELSIAPPEMSQAYTLEVTLPTCTLSRTIDVPGRPVIPVVQTSLASGDTIVQCGEETLQVIASTDAYSILEWSDGSVGDTLLTSQAGAYLLTASNDLGCASELPFVIQQRPLPQPDIIAPAGLCAGAATTLYLDDTAGLVFMEWSEGNYEGDSLLVEAGGLYGIQVLDAFGCMGVDSVQVLNWPLPQPSLVADSLVCPGATTSVTLDTVYATYHWNSGAMTPTVSIAAGEYAVTVSDANGCFGSASLSIQEWPQYRAVLTGDTSICQGDTAWLHVDLDGIETSFEATLIDSNGQVAGVSFGQDGTAMYPIIGTATQLFRLGTVSMADYACQVELEGASMVKVNQLLAEAEIEPIICHGSATGSISLSATSDFPPFSIEWSDGDWGEVREGLPAGNYIFQLTDQLGCQFLDSLRLEETPPLSPSLTVLPPTCFRNKDGQISIDTVLNGWPPFELYFLGQTTIIHGGTAEFQDLEAGTYELMLVDAQGCRYDTALFLREPQELVLDLGRDRVIPLGDSARLSAVVNLVHPASFIWIDTTGLRQLDAFTWEARPYATQFYTLTAVDSAGCTVTDTVMISVNRQLDVFVPNAFSPNGDGSNDQFAVFSRPGLVESVVGLQVFDRWGALVFEKRDFHPNVPEEGWKGIGPNQQPSPPGVYVWHASLRLIDGSTAVLSGDLVLVR